MTGRRSDPLSIIAGEPYTHRLTVHNSDGDPEPELAATARNVIKRGTATVELDMQLLDAEGAVVLFNLTEEQTADLERGLWHMGLELAGHTWVTGSAVVSEDPTP